MQLTYLETRHSWKNVTWLLSTFGSVAYYKAICFLFIVIVTYPVLMVASYTQLTNGCDCNRGSLKDYLATSYSLDGKAVMIKSSCSLKNLCM